MKRFLCLHVTLFAALLGTPAVGQEPEPESPVGMLVAVADSTGSPGGAGVALASHLTDALRGLPGVWPVSRVQLENALDRYDLREPRLSVIEWRQLAGRLNAEMLLLVVLKGGPPDGGNVLEVDMLNVRSGGRQPILRRALGELIATSLVDVLGLELAGIGSLRHWPYEPPPRLVNEEEVTQAIERSYPPDLRRAGVGGTVELWVLVDPDGQTKHVSIRESSGHAELDAAALEVARVMRFERARNRIALSPVFSSQTVVFEPE